MRTFLVIFCINCVPWIYELSIYELGLLKSLNITWYDNNTFLVYTYIFLMLFLLCLHPSCTVNLVYHPDLQWPLRTRLAEYPAWMYLVRFRSRSSTSSATEWNVAFYTLLVSHCPFKSNVTLTNRKACFRKEFGYEHFTHKIRSVTFFRCTLLYSQYIFLQILV